jgi:hypothetical protein
MKMFQDKRVQANSPASDALSLRMTDHREIQALFAQYDRLVTQGAIGEARRALAETICMTLTVHITAEEELFYPAAFGAIGDQDVLREAAAMHHSARHLIADIVDMTSSDPMLDTSIKLLNERVDHHMLEEQRRLFPRLRTAGSDLGLLGARITERKGELMAEMHETEA